LNVPPLEIISRVAGTVVTENTSEADCALVSFAVAKTCCVEAPFCAVPFSVNCSRFVWGSCAFVCGAAVPLYVAK